MKVVVVGAGAVGGYFGGRLQKTGFDMGEERSMGIRQFQNKINRRKVI